MSLISGMWPFKPSQSTPQQSETERELRERMGELERRIELLDVEWSEWYDKLRLLYARIAKRAAAVEAAAEKSAEDAPHATNGAGHSLGSVRGVRRNLRGF